MNKHKIVKICDNLIEAGWLLIAFIVPIIFTYLPVLHNLIQLPKAVIFSILVEIMFIAYILKIFIQGEIRFKVFDKKILIILSLLILSNLISLYFSIHPLRSWLGEYTRQNGFYIFIHYILFFLLLLFNLREWKQVRRIILSILFSSAIVCFYGLMQYMSLGFTEWQRTAFAPVNGRIYSSLGQPNFFGHYLIMVIPVSIFSLFFAVKKFLSKFFVIILVVLQAVCLLLTYSRSAWMGFIFEIILFLLVFILFYKNRIFTKKLVFRYYLPILIIITFVIISFQYFQDNEKKYNFSIERIKSIANIKSGSVQLRLFYWQSAIEEIKNMDAKSLLFGYGQENISDVYVKYYEPKWGIYEEINSYPDRSHNAVLDIIFTTGLVGLFIYFIFFYYIIYLAFKYIKNIKTKDKNFWLVISLIILLVGYFINNLFSFSTVAAYIYLFIALALISFLTLKNREKVIEINLTKISRVLIFLNIILVIGISVFLYNVKPIIADYYLMKADIAKEEKNCQGVLDNLNKVIKWQLSNIYYLDWYIKNSLNCITRENSMDNNIKIKNNILGAIELMEEKERYYKTDLNIARAFSIFGFHFSEKFGHRFYEIADEEFQKLLEINPSFTYVYKDWGRMKLWQGEYDDAIIILNKGLENSIPDLNSPSLNQGHKDGINNELIIFYLNLGESYLKNGDKDKAIEYGEKALDLSPNNK